MTSPNSDLDYKIVSELRGAYSVSPAPAHVDVSGLERRLRRRRRFGSAAASVVAVFGVALGVHVLDRPDQSVASPVSQQTSDVPPVPETCMGGAGGGSGDASDQGGSLHIYPPGTDNGAATATEAALARYPLSADEKLVIRPPDQEGPSMARIDYVANSGEVRSTFIVTEYQSGWVVTSVYGCAVSGTP